MPPNTIAERLNWLFENVRKENSRPFTHQEVEDGTALLGNRVTTTTIWSIRNGKTTNPGVLTLRAIARFFQVNPDFFTREEMGEDDYELIRRQAAPTDPATNEIMLRASELDDEGKQALLNMIRLIARREGHLSSDES